LCPLGRRNGPPEGCLVPAPPLRGPAGFVPADGAPATSTQRVSVLSFGTGHRTFGTLATTIGARVRLGLSRRGSRLPADGAGPFDGGAPSVPGPPRSGLRGKQTAGVVDRPAPNQSGANASLPVARVIRASSPRPTDAPFAAPTGSSEFGRMDRRAGRDDGQDVCPRKKPVRFVPKLARRMVQEKNPRWQS